MKDAFYFDKNGLKKKAPKKRTSPEHRMMSRFRQVAWRAMNARTVNGTCPQWNDKQKQRYFERGVRLEMSKDEFYAWCEVNRAAIFDLLLSNKKPSIDRVDSFGHYSPENIRVISLSENSKKGSALGKANMIAKTSKPVVAVNLITREIKTYPSVSEAGRSIGVSFKHVSACCLGKRKTCGGYRFEFMRKTS